MLLASRHRHPPRRRRANGAVAEQTLPLALCLVLLAIIASAVLCYSYRARSSSTDRHEERDRRNQPGLRAAVAVAPRVTIFSAAPVGGSPSWQELAVRSWLALPGDVSVVLLGGHPSNHALAGRFGGRVAVDPAVDSSFTGTPFFHSMVARAQAADSDVCVLVDAETVLLPETAALLKHFSRIDRDWLIVAVSRNVSNFPNNFSNAKQWAHADGDEVSFTKLFQEIAADKWTTDGSDRGLFVAWNNPGRPLLAGVIPSFLYGKGVHNWWLAHEVVSSETRHVFDATNLVLGLYPQNFIGHRGVIGSSRNGSSPDESWEYNVNRHLAGVYGSYCYQLSSPMLYEVVKQSEDYVLRKIEDPNLSDSVISKEQIVHVEEGRVWSKENICLPGNRHGYPSETSGTVNFPHTLEMILQIAADKNRSVVLAVAGASYRDMLMSWVCRLRNLRVTNFVVCALDYETYEFAVLQGLPVFRDPLSPKNVSFDDCHFGTQCFQQVTKTKSRIVLKILRLGYNVLLSDVDVYWFHNPVPFLYSVGPGTLAAQSDEYNETGPINLPRRLNSGFYYARSDNATITAMEMIVKHAANSNLSEQPSFYDVLCGEEGANRSGGNKCLEPNTNLTVVFLSQDLFPNGAYMNLWEKNDVHSACRELGCFIIHNNWVNGRGNKLRRQMASGLWDYDPSSRLCLHNWSDNAISFEVQNHDQISHD